MTIPARYEGPAGGSVAFGEVATSSVTTAAVNKTTYTEQAANAGRRLVSSSVNDAAAGTGARTVKITYFTVLGDVPNTETVALNGTTAVNTVNTDICFIEKMEVLTAGSGGVPAGAITLHSTPTSGGVAVASIAAGDNRTMYAHHYVARGRTCQVQSQSVNSSSAAAADGGDFVLKSTPIGGVAKQLGDTMRANGAQHTVHRYFGTPVQVDGPAHIQASVTSASTTATTHRAAFDFIE